MGRDPRSLHSQCPTLYFPCQRQRLQTRRYGDGLVGRATRGAPQARPPAGRGEGKGREARAQQSSSCAGSVRRGATGGLFSSRGPLLAPPLLQGPAHPHGHHSGVSVIELHDERVAHQFFRCWPFFWLFSHTLSDEMYKRLRELSNWKDGRILINNALQKLERH